MIRRLGLDSMIASKRSRERDLVVAMIAERLIHPCSKLATTRLWHETTLARELGVENAAVDELYEAMHWLLKRQNRLEKKLARLHLTEGGLVLYDVTSSYYKGRTCPLVYYGYNRDKKKGRPQIVYGVMTNEKGCPVSIDVYPGNTADPATMPDQVEKLLKRFELSRAVIVGERGMLTQARIDSLKKHPELGWISALRSQAIRQLAAKGEIQLSLFDEKNIAEITSPDFPGERLVVCFNPLLAEERKRKREELLVATEKALDKIVSQVARRTKKPLLKEEIAAKFGKVIGRHKMEKHFNSKIEDGQFDWSRNEESISREQAIDGIYVIRTSEPKQRLSAEETVRKYKSLSFVERVFRTFKGIDLRVRPINHRLATTVRAHFFLCFLAYYVEWHMRQALAPLLFADEELELKSKNRDPVAPAKPSESAKRKKTKLQTANGFPVHSFNTLMEMLATRTKNFCRPDSIPEIEPIEVISDPTPLQSEVFKLLRLYPVERN